MDYNVHRTQGTYFQVSLLQRLLSGVKGKQTLLFFSGEAKQVKDRFVYQRCTYGAVVVVQRSEVFYVVTKFAFALLLKYYFHSPCAAYLQEQNKGIYWFSINMS